MRYLKCLRTTFIALRNQVQHNKDNFSYLNLFQNIFLMFYSFCIYNSMKYSYLYKGYGAGWRCQSLTFTTNRNKFNIKEPKRYSISICRIIKYIGTKHFFFCKEQVERS